MQRKTLLCTGISLILLTAIGLVVAQPAGGARDGARGGGRGNFDPAQFRERMMERLQEQLAMTDTEMTAVKPLLEKVMDLNDQLNPRGFRFGRFGGRGGDDEPQDTSDLTGLAKVSAELRNLLRNDSATPEQIKAKVTEYRKTRETLQKQLTEAQAKLVAVLSVKQEATLLMMGQIQ